MSAALPRRAAAELLIETLDNRRTLDEAFDTSDTFTRLKGADRAFARAMASAALRELGRIDKGLSPFLNRPLETATPPARALLRIGAAQTWLMETPDHATVSETVDAAKAWPRARSSAGFVNAVMRKAIANRSVFDAVPATALWPDWLNVAMMTSLGVEAAGALAALQRDPPKLHLTPKDPDAARALAADLGGAVLDGYTVETEPGRVDEIEGFGEGSWWVQDAAAAMPARLLAPQPGDHVIDLCAAPGGKTLQLAASGARVTALDRSSARLDRLRQNLERTGLADRVDIVTAKAEDWQPDTKADRVLLDAPCSALGTLRRHPEGAWIKRAEDIARFPQVQLRLLEAAASMLKPGGTLVYCVCTPLSVEGLGVVERALERGALEREPFTETEAGAFTPSLTHEGDLLTLPKQAFGHDAFYIARLRAKT